MLVFPNCKINLGLRILNKREDGYHNLETIFYPVPLTDALEIIPSNNVDPVQFSSSGFVVSGDITDNLCVKAYLLLKKDFLKLPSVKIHLHKAIPMGAGLGGGSSDAAFTLQLLNNQFELNLSTDQLISYALQLGSDCPFFIINQPCIGTGRGEILEKISLDLSEYQLLLVNPGIHVNTSQAFSSLQLPPINAHPTPDLLAKIIKQPIDSWRYHLSNDFEKSVFGNYAAIQEIKELIYKAGASYAAMSGSGSTVFGLFRKPLKPAISFNPGYFVSIISL